MALKYLFPDVDVDDSKFLGLQHIFLLYASNIYNIEFTKREKVKIFLQTFAQQNKFDPLNPENWYEVSSLTLWDSGKVLKETIISF